MFASGKSQRPGEGQRAQRDGRPVKHDAPEPVASAGHAPDVVERLLDIREHLNGHHHQQQHANRAERAAAGFLDEIADFPDYLFLRGGGTGFGSGGSRQISFRRRIGRDLGRRGIRGDQGGRGIWAGIRRSFLLIGAERCRGHDGGDKFVNGLIDFFLALAFQQAAGDADGDREQGNEREQGGVGQGGGADGTAVAHETPDDQRAKVREPFEPAQFAFRAGVNAGQNFNET